MEGWRLNLIPATGANGGGSVTFNSGTVVANPIYPNGFVVSSNSVVMVRYVGHNVGIPTGQLWVTVSGASVIVESSAALDNNQVEILIMNP